MEYDALRSNLNSKREFSLFDKQTIFFDFSITYKIRIPGMSASALFQSMNAGFCRIRETNIVISWRARLGVSMRAGVAFYLRHFYLVIREDSMGWWRRLVCVVLPASPGSLLPGAMNPELKASPKHEKTPAKLEGER